MIFIMVRILLLLILFCKLSSTLKCYECSGYVPCGNGQTNLLVNCPGKCIVYKNQFDQGMIVRRCCYSNCGSDGMNIYEGRLTYVCSNDMCNGNTADTFLTEEEGSGQELESTTKLLTISSTSTNLVSIPSQSLSCHECTGHYSGCGTSQSTIISNCRMCMVYFNQWDGNTVVRRCCYSNCGPSNSVSKYEGRQTYFCSSNLCNGIGSENAINNRKGQFLAGDSFPTN